MSKLGGWVRVTMNNNREKPKNPRARRMLMMVYENKGNLQLQLINSYGYFYCEYSDDQYR